jgi:excinuclease ABC subunit B
MGRAARNVNALVVMYADEMTPAMQAAIEETDRRREKQIAYNTAHGITPETIRKAIRRGMEVELRARKTAREAVASSEETFDAAELVRQLEDEMLEAAQSLEFERAAALRDQAAELTKRIEAGDGGPVRRSDVEKRGRKSGKRPGMPGVKAGKRKRKRH